MLRILFKVVGLMLISLSGYGSSYETPPFVIDSIRNILRISDDHILVAADTTDNWSIGEVHKNPDRFIPILNYFEQHGLLQPNISYWGKIRVINDLSQDTQWLLEIGSRNSYVDVYTRAADGTFDLQSTGQYLPVSERAIAANVGNSVWINLLSGETKEIYIKVKRITGFRPRLSMQLILPEYWMSRDVTFENFVTGLIEGALGIMSLFFLFYYATSKDKTYLYYSLFLFFLAFYYLFDYQYFFTDALLGDYVHLKLYPWLLASLFYVFLVLFVRSFLNVAHRFPRLYLIFRWMIIIRLALLIVSFGILLWSYNLDWVDQLYASGLNYVEVAAWILITIYLAFQQKSRADRFVLFGVGIFAICIGMVLLTFQVPGFHQYWIPYLLNLGLTAQVICFSVALGIRQRDRQRSENERLESTVEERTQKIRQQTLKLENLTQFRSHLLANISHEFRTPLTLIINPLKKLIQSGEKGQLLSQYRQMKFQAESLLHFVEQLLMLSRSESANFQLQYEKENIIDHLRPVLFSFYGQAESQNIEYQVSLPSSPLIVRADLSKISMILNNLLSNAFKFTHERGCVSVTLEARGEQLVIVVQDDGIGIAAYEHQEIFERFYQSQKGRKYSAVGTGIGLSLVQEIVQLHAGTVEVESQLEQGSTFTVTLPVIVSEDLPALQQPKQPLIQHTVLGGGKENDKVAEDAPQLLLVEDNLHMRKHLRGILQYDYRLLLASDGIEGQRMTEDFLPDLIITDVAMPRQDGVELTQAIKGNLFTSHIPVIMLTAWATPEHQIRGWKHGADAYIAKPFDEKLLKVRIDNLLAERIRLKEYYREKLLSPQFEDGSNYDRMNATDPFINELENAMERYYSDSTLSVEILSREVGLSSSHLNRKLKSIFKQSTNEFIRSYRMQKAAELLKSTDLDIAQVAYDVGFATPSYFTQRFQKHFGKLPSQYQKQARNNSSA